MWIIELPQHKSDALRVKKISIIQEAFNTADRWGISTSRCIVLSDDGSEAWRLIPQHMELLI